MEVLTLLTLAAPVAGFRFTVRVEAVAIGLSAMRRATSVTSGKILFTCVFIEIQVLAFEVKSTLLNGKSNPLFRDHDTTGRKSARLAAAFDPHYPIPAHHGPVLDLSAGDNIPTQFRHLFWGGFWGLQDFECGQIHYLDRVVHDRRHLS